MKWRPIGSSITFGRQSTFLAIGNGAPTCSALTTMERNFQKLNERPWYFVKETPGVLGFADGDRPAPMRPSEVEGMLAQIREKEEKVTPKVIFAVGDRVKVGDGPFQNQEGVIEEVDTERGRVRVAVSIFGRSTPVELEYWQEEKT